METRKRSKRYQQRTKGLEVGKKYSLSDAIKNLKKVSGNKYDETITLDFQLGIRLDSGTENVRGTVSLPHGTGKSIRVIAFVKGEAAREAKEAGADQVGAEELVQKISEGWFEFDAVVAHPDMMREVSKLGRVLGPRGLMPTPKTGTVTPAVAKAVKELKAGRIEFKSDKTGGLHAVCGKLSFSENALIENAGIVIRAVQEAKPAGAKGDYIRTVTVALSQGPGLPLALNALSN